MSSFRDILQKCRDAIKKIAPNKLYLGSRLHDGALRKGSFFCSG